MISHVDGGIALGQIAAVGSVGASTIKVHNLTLDWLRGVAAVAVVAFHMGARLDLPLLARHGYLAVDFFFVLSGFVIAKAYEERLADGTLPAGAFFKTRAIRLLPMVIAGTFLAAVIEVGRPGVLDQNLHLREGLVALIFGSALIPTMWSTTLEATVFPLNGPMWTLFFEVLSNIAFVPWARLRLGRGWLWAAMLISLPFLIYGTVTHGKLDFGAVPDDFWYGFARIGWSFPIGVLLYHFRQHAPRSNPVLITIALLALFFTPVWYNPLYDLISVTLILPYIVITATNCHISPTLARFSGNISYPMYAIHYPIARIIGVIGIKMNLSALSRIGFSLIGLASIVIISALVFRYYDEPVRAWLSPRKKER
jgi:peptidoglycan/LPS O-acetylase OafA/YrhL